MHTHTRRAFHRFHVQRAAKDTNLGCAGFSSPSSIRPFSGKKLKASAFDGFLHEKHRNKETEQLPAQPSEPASTR